MSEEEDNERYTYLRIGCHELNVALGTSGINVFGELRDEHQDSLR
jgi:hypothetical protein